MRCKDCIETDNNWIKKKQQQEEVKALALAHTHTHSHTNTNHLYENKEETREQEHPRCSENLMESKFNPMWTFRKEKKGTLTSTPAPTSIHLDCAMSSEARMEMKNDEQAIYEMKMKIDCGVNASFLEK